MKFHSKSPKSPLGKLLLFFASLILLAPFVILMTTEIKARENRTSQVVILDPHVGEKRDFYFLKGNVVEIKGEIWGDVYVLAREVKVEGSVNGDLIVVARIADLKGSVSQDARILAEKTNISGEVGRNLTVIGMKLLIQKSGKVSGGLAGFLTEADLNGAIEGEVKLNAQNLVLNSRIGESAELWGENITLEEDSLIDGDLTYHSESTVNVKKSTSISGNLVKSPLSRHEFDSGFLGEIKFVSKCLNYVGLLVTGLLLIRLFPGTVKSIAAKMVNYPVKSFFAGFLTLFSLPLLSVFLLVTVVGAPLGLIFALFYVLAIYVSKVFVSVRVGNLILKKKNTSINFAFGLLIFYLLSFFSFLKWVNFIVIIFGLGATALFLKEISGKKPTQTKRPYV